MTAVSLSPHQFAAKAGEAAEVYDEVRRSEVPKPRKLSGPKPFSLEWVMQQRG